MTVEQLIASLRGYKPTSEVLVYVESASKCFTISDVEDGIDDDPDYSAIIYLHDQTNMNLTVGTRVYWNDPDKDLASGNGTIIKLQHSPPAEDSVITLKMDDGSEVECLRHELDKPTQ